MTETIGSKLPDDVVRHALPPSMSPSGLGDMAAASSSSAGGGEGGLGEVYFSPVVRVDPETQRAVLVYRDALTGDVEAQYPSEKKMEAYRAAQRRSGQAELEGTGAPVAGSLHAGNPRPEAIPGSGATPSNSPKAAEAGPQRDVTLNGAVVA